MGGGSIRSKFNCNKLRGFLDRLEESKISFKDVESGIQTLENLSSILNESKIPLPSYPILEEAKSESEGERDQTQHCWIELLARLRKLSIALLNNKKISEIGDKNQPKKASKRRLEPEQEESLDSSKIPKIDPMKVLSKLSELKDLVDICYICKKKIPVKAELRHPFSPWMCIKCGDFNYGKRFQSAYLTGKVALVTGGRIKIGYEIALKLLRAGAKAVIITTRFPIDAIRRFESESDSNNWIHRLHVYSLDLRFLPEVELFCEKVQQFDQLDILIQNAAQTIRRPSAYYRGLVNSEILSPHELQNRSESPLANKDFLSITTNLPPSTTTVSKISTDETVTPCHPTQILSHTEDYRYANSPILVQEHFPANRLDSDGNQIDLRRRNSWILKLHEVEIPEMVETSLVNYIAPYVILQKLTPFMRRKRNERKDNWRFAILVTAMEGKFNDCAKTGFHPHTNAAKAALNMLVRTSGKQYYKEFGIILNAVDTGWVTEEYPVLWNGKPHSSSTPLDSIDGAARVLDPVFQSLNHPRRKRIYGKFLKDFEVTSW